MTEHGLGRIPASDDRNLTMPGASDVLFVGHRLQVIGVNASSVVTKVVEVHPIRNAATVALIHSTMGRRRLSAEPPVSIPLLAAIPHPNPAADVVNNVRQPLTTAVMIGHKANGLSPDVSDRRVAGRRDGGRATATTHAQTGRIWSFTFRRDGQAEARSTTNSLAINRDAAITTGGTLVRHFLNLLHRFGGVVAGGVSAPAGLFV